MIIYKKCRYTTTCCKKTPTIKKGISIKNYVMLKKDNICDSYLFC